ncbi:MAG: 16S rRNA (guanine(966)-N(2))-methyltransferase RsmD [Rhodospirillaceae bacterium]|nr:16S rRNA (guanine(966)-N(2))-methyltransferase RsmD [Rhodospirillaceae bacterium]
MRIIAGAWRGRKLAVPAGFEVRPTSARAREAVFNRLAHGFTERGFRLPGAVVADLFAGTGAFGFEALSRGAAFASFIDTAPEIAARLAEAAARLGAEDRVSVMTGDATRLPRPPRRCDLAFLDPPYGAGLAAPALGSLVAMGWLRPGALVVVEQGDDEPVLAVAGLAPIDERRYGRARVLFMQADA